MHYLATSKRKMGTENRTSFIVKLLVFSVHLLCMTTSTVSSYRAIQRSSLAETCQKADWRWESYCCKTNRSHGNPLPTKARVELRRAENTIACMVSLQEAYERNDGFPMGCCAAPTFHKLCSQAKFDQNSLDGLMKGHLIGPDVLRRRGPAARCSAKLLDRCCRGFDIQYRTTNERSEIITGQRLFVPILDNLAKCALQVVINLTLGNRRLPQVCCKIPVFWRICREQSTPAPPSPQEPPEPPSPPKPSAPPIVQPMPPGGDS
jgi:hypothetical protein